MEDSQIVGLYWQRSEEAIPETARKYGGYQTWEPIARGFYSGKPGRITLPGFHIIPAAHCFMLVHGKFIKI